MMKINENLAAVHAYLCADGYVIRNPETQKQKYYKIGFRNTNLILLKDFQTRFEKLFRIKPSLYPKQRCQIGSKEIYSRLTEEFGSFYSWEWRMPKLNENLIRIWLRAYFDCEGWVFCKRHQNRHIGVDCVNKTGINQVEKSLNKLGIKTIRKFNKKRNIHRIIIYGKENIIKFRDKIGFIHPDKSINLNKAIEDFVVYEWNFPSNKKELCEFIKELFIQKARIRKPGYIRIFSKEASNLEKLKNYLKEFFDIESKTYRRVNGIGTVYYELDINKRKEVQKIIDLKLIPNIFKHRKT